MDIKTLQENLARYGQEHLLKFWPSLTHDQRTLLYNDLASIDFAEVTDILQHCNLTPSTENGKLDELLQPIPDELHGRSSRTDPDLLKTYRTEGLRQVAEGRVAVLLLAGGQGTRLGVTYPKGMYNVGLPSQKTLYQLQGERIVRLEHLAEEVIGQRGTVPWYIMASEHTMEPTLEFFASHDYFGLRKENLVVFEQGMLPCFTFDGKMILESPWKIARAPDGNGGLYRALRKRGIINDMERRGIKYVHVYCVDNILVKMADPIFIGYCISKGANCAAKVVEKSYPMEPVGVVCKVAGKYQVVEYSEITSRTAQKCNPDGSLMFNAANICNHFFTLDFLRDVTNSNTLKHHIAKKKIPYTNDNGQKIKPEKPNGIKLEKFVFDVFEFTEYVLFKLPPGWSFYGFAASQNLPFLCGSIFHYSAPSVCQNGTTNGHGQYSGEYINDESIKPYLEKTVVCEISPLITYDGEGLEEFVKGKIFVPPVILNFQQGHNLHQCGANNIRSD
ncbi:UDP-N-acetylhexosamine pyrophosphorylase-like [Limulus polyphemus]|uniref:UDP-N-acetylglucosamine diphosphorylase n=1 Tax=Limulus polyphemus TaxID=6850 RepID=A0ABM1T9J9_LIMPO|nr:UDP-N-acetylhexosamine pyrophosphorylase-like [Limulus polyphemus]